MSVVSSMLFFTVVLLFSTVQSRRVLDIEDVREYRMKDMIFVLDTSGSVGRTHFKTMLNKCKEIVDQHSVGRYSTKFGLDVFSTYARTEIKLKDYSTNYSLKRAIGNVRYRSGMTNTYKALDRLRQTSFLPYYGHRTGAEKIAIVMTDGRSQMKQKTLDAAREAKRSGIKIIAFGIGSNIDWEEVIGIATQGLFTESGRPVDTAFRIKNFRTLKSFRVRRLNAAFAARRGK